MSEPTSARSGDCGRHSLTTEAQTDQQRRDRLERILGATRRPPAAAPHFDYDQATAIARGAQREDTP